MYVLGIRDSTEIKSKVHLEQEALTHFQETVRINAEGKYEVHLPRIEGTYVHSYIRTYIHTL